MRRLVQKLRYHRQFSTPTHRKMGKNKRGNLPNEELLHLPPHPSLTGATSPIIDTHTHVASTFAAYRSKYKEGRYQTAFEFVRAMCKDRNVEAIVDVWCEAPVQRCWKEFADSALTTDDRNRNWGGIEYWFVMGISSTSMHSYHNSSNLLSF
jgi:TatD DNase family protein